MAVSRQNIIVFILAGLIASALPARADIHSWRDSTGTVHLSNTRLPDLPVFRNSDPDPRPAGGGT